MCSADSEGALDLVHGVDAAGLLGVQHIHRGRAGAAHLAVGKERGVHGEGLERVGAEPLGQLGHVLAAGVVEVLARGKDLHRLRAGAVRELKQARVQTVIQKQMSRKNAQHGHNRSGNRAGTKVPGHYSDCLIPQQVTAEGYCMRRCVRVSSRRLCRSGCGGPGRPAVRRFWGRRRCIRRWTSDRPRMLERVAHGAQAGDRLRRKAWLEVELVGQVLMVEARRVHGLLDVQAALGRGEKDVGHGGDDARAAGRAQHEAQLAVFKHDGGRHGAERALAGRDGVGRPLDQADTCWARPASTAKSSISSLSRKPSEPAVTCEPKASLSVVVTATALPSPSTTE